MAPPDAKIAAENERSDFFQRKFLRDEGLPLASINRAGVRFIILHRSYNPVATLLLLSHYVRNLASGKAPPRLVTRDAAPHSRGIKPRKILAKKTFPLATRRKSAVTGGEFSQGRRN